LFVERTRDFCCSAKSLWESVAPEGEKKEKGKGTELSRSSEILGVEGREIGLTLGHWGRKGHNKRDERFLGGGKRRGEKKGNLTIVAHLMRCCDLRELEGFVLMQLKCE